MKSTAAREFPESGCLWLCLRFEAAPHKAGRPVAAEAVPWEEHSTTESRDRRRTAPVKARRKLKTAVRQLQNSQTGLALAAMKRWTACPAAQVPGPGVR